MIWGRGGPGKWSKGWLCLDESSISMSTTLERNNYCHFNRIWWLPIQDSSSKYPYTQAARAMVRSTLHPVHLSEYMQPMWSKNWHLNKLVAQSATGLFQLPIMCYFHGLNQFRWLWTRWVALPFGYLLNSLSFAFLFLTSGVQLFMYTKINHLIGHETNPVRWD